jgi:hypothetical protein
MRDADAFCCIIRRTWEWGALSVIDLPNQRGAEHDACVDQAYCSSFYSIPIIKRNDYERSNPKSPMEDTSD